MRADFFPGSRALALVTALLVISSVSAFGQTGQSQQGGQAPVTRLTVDDAVRLALEQNLNLQVERVNPRIQDMTTAQARAAWAPTVFGGFSRDSNSSRPSNFLSGSGTKTTQATLGSSAGVQQLIPWGGGDYRVQWSTGRTSSDNPFNNFSPQLSSSFSASVTQPLLRNFLIDSTRQQLLVSRKNLEISEIQLRQTVLTTVRNVKYAYWNLSYAISNLEVQRLTLDLAKESLKNNRARVEVGTMAPIDIVQAEAEVAQREESVIVAEAAVAQAEDSLRALIYDPATPNFWNLKLELTEAPKFESREVDVEGAIQNALANRTDIVQSRKTLERNDIELKYYRNQILPEVNVDATFRTTGVGGTLRDVGIDENGLPVLRSEVKRSYTDALREMFRRDYPTWTFQVSVGYPIGRSAAEANLARARLSRNQAEINLRAQELSVASTVRNAARQVSTNNKRVEATRAARTLAERRLDAETKKMAAGMSNAFFVLQAQRDLATARNSELLAILDYTRSVVDFETIQEAPLGGGSGITVR